MFYLFWYFVNVVITLYLHLLFYKQVSNPLNWLQDVLTFKIYGLVVKNWTCKDIPISASDFVPSRLLIDQLCISIFQCCAFLDVHLTRQRGLKMAIIGSDAPELQTCVDNFNISENACVCRKCDLKLYINICFFLF